MFKVALALILLLGINFSMTSKIEEFTPIENELPLIWKTQIGLASFRSNIIVQNNDIIIGSNGENFMDNYLWDKQSGVHVLDRITGKNKKIIANQSFGDMDVNGVLLLKDKIYFGNDNEEFLCTTKDGKIIWRNPTAGDIEHEPILIKNNIGKPMIVYATEEGAVTAVDPETGEHIWNYYVAGFTGWKPGKNVAIFKVKVLFDNLSAFVTKPVLADLNKDGVNDLIYKYYFENTIIAIDGSSGKELWSYKGESYGRGAPVGIIYSNNDPLIFLSSRNENVFRIIDRKGKLIKEHTIPVNKYIKSLKLLNLDNQKLVFDTPDSLYFINADGIYDKIGHPAEFHFISEDEYHEPRKRNYLESIYGNVIFPFQDHQRCIMVLNQRDGAHYQKGFIEIISLETKEILTILQLPGVSEMPPQIMDINKDGNLDVLINCFDGNLYCYSLKK